MGKTYYVIELTPRWLAVVLVAMAGLVVVAFVLGYGAAVSQRPSSVGPPRIAGITPTPTIAEVEIDSSDSDRVIPSEATPVPMDPTITPPPGWQPAGATPAAPPPTQAPATATPTPRPPATPAPTEFWVQVLASSRRDSIAEARTTLEDAGFPPSHQNVVQTRVAGGNVLFKLRVGPFPDRPSADRVMVRMQRAGFPDAWVVTP